MPWVVISILDRNFGTFSNDMTTFSSKDDILTLLVHFGYLTYDSVHTTVEIPNREVAKEYVNAISTMDWKEVFTAIQNFDYCWNKL
ncbi:hypothetical protein [Dorea sp. AM58-8]|uniref:hypothetical protein n=1 Tax=Dorea sp. AM58-8 TaxID=2292346 RepID=UPI00268B4004|nr:hypothetical protein [Dorea sp. AM58-8]